MTVIARSEATRQSSLARLLSTRVDPDHSETIALTVSLLEARNQQGQAYAFIDEFAGQPLPGEEGEEHAEDCLTLPAKEVWLEVLNASDLVGDGSGDEPVVLDADHKLRFARFHHAEQRIWEHIHARLKTPVDETGFDELETLVEQLFGSPPEGTDINWQAVAAVSALRHRFCVITGGPGTGKTHTVARVLALLLTHEQGLRIALAAPTGKAANRLTESIRGQVDGLPVGEAIKEKLGAEAKTIHRLLGYVPTTDSFRFNNRRKLDADVLVVDEASMVGLLLMDGLFEAMPSHGRVIILGDEYQLPSVDAGDLLAEICREAEKSNSHGPDFVALCRKLTGYQMEPGKVTAPLRDAVVRLKHSYRFDKKSGIGLLTEAVRVGDSVKALEILENDKYPEVVRRDLPENAEELLESVVPFLRDYLKSPSPEAALEKLSELRFLSATRVGRWGSIKLNDYIEAFLRRSRMIGPGRHYLAQPVMVTRNDYQTNLFNGDVGVCWHEAEQVIVCFKMTDGMVRKVPLSKLPPHEPAWALTVHKSQGSEFDQGYIFLDAESSDWVDSAKLVYTALTRFMSRLTVYWSE